MPAKFPETPATLLVKLSAEATKQDEAAWARFVEMYTPVMRMYFGFERGVTETEIDDLVQDLFVRIVGVMRRSGYDRGRSRFRTYLVSLMKHILIDRQRRRTVRRMDETETLNDAFICSPGPDAAELVDIRLRLAEREAALKHLETNSAVPAEHIAIYRAYAIDGEKAGTVAERYSVSVANVRQIKRRLSAALKALG